MIKEIATNRHSSEAFMFTCHCCSKCTGLSSQGQVTAKTANSIQGSHWKKKPVCFICLSLVIRSRKKHCDKVDC